MASKVIRAAAGHTAVMAADARPGVLRRFIAYMLDWFIGDLFASFPVTILYAMIFNTQELNNNLADFPLNQGILAGALAVLFSLVYFVLLPWKVFRGQTVGKKLCGLRIVGKDGERARLKALLLRQVLGIFLIEGCLVSASQYLRQMAALITGESWVVTYPYYAGLAFALVSCVLILFGPSKRGLHDYIAGTRVEAVS